MSSPGENVMAESNRVGVQFLLTDIEAGLTFLCVAQTTLVPENRERNLGHAIQAYATVQRLMPRVTPLPAELKELQLKLAELHRGLVAAGCPVEPYPGGSSDG